MFVQSEKFVEAHGGGRDDISIYGEELYPQTWRLGKMNLAIRGITANLGPRAADSFHDDLHKDLKADFVLEQLAVSAIEVFGRRAPPARHPLEIGTPPTNANFAWVQHFIYHLAPHGLAGFVLRRTACCPRTSRAKARSERQLSKLILSIASLRCRSALYTTQIPVSLWFLARDKSNGILKDKRLRDRRGKRCLLMHVHWVVWKLALCVFSRSR